MRGGAQRFRERYGPWGVVAGGSDGIGAEFARRLAALGLDLVLVGRRPDPLAETALGLERNHAVRVRVIGADLSERGGVEELLAQTRELSVGFLVCNAAMSAVGPFLEQSAEEHERMIDLNCRMPMLLAYGFGRRMRAAGRGGIILLSSMASFQGTLLTAHYAATKAYVRVLAEGLWAEFRPFGVDVIASCPGTVNTPTFLRDDPVYRPLASLPVMECAPTVTQTLAALGRAPVVVPGALNRLLSFLMLRVFPRKTVISLTAKGTRAMYPRLAARLEPSRGRERAAGGRQ